MSSQSALQQPTYEAVAGSGRGEGSGTTTAAAAANACSATFAHQVIEEKMYEPLHFGGSESVVSLSDVTANVTSEEAPPTAIVRGATGYAAYLNGTYRRVEDASHDGRLYYRTERPVPPGYGPPSGHLLYLYFKAKQRAWAIGMRVGSSGVAAFWKGDVPHPCVARHIYASVWNTTDEQGHFSPNTSMVCEGAGGYTVPAHLYGDANLARPAGDGGGGDGRHDSPGPGPGPGTGPGTDGSSSTSSSSTSTSAAASLLAPCGTSRSTAEYMLEQFSLRKEGGSEALYCYVLRESTSAMRTYILSLLTPTGIQHLRIETIMEGDAAGCVQLAGTTVSHTSLAALVDYYARSDLVTGDGACVRLGRHIKAKPRTGTPHASPAFARKVYKPRN